MFSEITCVRWSEVKLVEEVLVFFWKKDDEHYSLQDQICLGCKVTLVAFFFTFLHCAFSNVFSNRLPEKRHSHIGCIFFTFPHCAFSNVSSDGLHEKRYICIGYICLIFLPSVFLDVFSNDLPEKRHSHIGCIFFYFSPLCIFKCVLKLLTCEDA